MEKHSVVTLPARQSPFIEGQATHQATSDDFQPTAGCYVRRNANEFASAR